MEKNELQRLVYGELLVEHPIIYVSQNKFGLYITESMCESSVWFKHILFRRKGLGAAYNVTMPSPWEFGLSEDRGGLYAIAISIAMDTRNNSTLYTSC